MAFHHKIQPHHHVSIWAISVLTLLASASVYNTAYITMAQEGERPRDDGPSERTRSFFGDSGGAGGFDTPAECQRPSETTTNGEGDHTGDNGRELMAEQQTLLREIGEMERNINTLPETERGAYSQQLEAKKAREREIKATLDARGPDPNQPGAQQAQRTEGGEGAGPSDACKAAIVAQQKARFTTFRNNIGNILGTLGRVDAAVNKIEAMIPKLQAAGVDAAKIAKIQADIETIKSGSATIRDYFGTTKTTIDAFLGLADTDPSAAFERMKNLRGSSKSSSAATAADSLVPAFEDLESVVNEIKG